MTVQIGNRAYPKELLERVARQLCDIRGLRQDEIIRVPPNGHSHIRMARWKCFMEHEIIPQLQRDEAMKLLEGKP